MSFQGRNFREIITKAVCGEGQKQTKRIHHVAPAHKPTSLLGCWVINHTYNAQARDEQTVLIKGSFDINIWYAYHDDSKTEVISETVNYTDEINLTERDEESLGKEYDVFVKVMKQPNCVQCTIDTDDEKLVVEVEKEFLVKTIGETKVMVQISETTEILE